MAKPTAPVKKNETVTLIFEDLTHEGNGVGKVNGYPLFVPNALPGEEASVKVVKANKNFGYGKVLELTKESSERVAPVCDVHCSGCGLQHMSYRLQLEMKQNQVQNTMKKVAHLDHVPVHPIIGMDEPLHYRNKVQIPVGEKDGRLITGFYQKRSHRIMENTETCVTHNNVINNVVKSVRDIADNLGIPAYDEENHRGVLRHIVVRTGEATNEIMVVLVTRTEKLPEHDAFVEELTKTYPAIRSIMQNVNGERTNVILGKKTKRLWGEKYIYDRIGDLTFAISAKSFYQVNPMQTKTLYDKALEYAQLGAKDTVIDAYCGIGTISLFMAKEAKDVYGVETVSEAVDDAKKNAKLNGITNASFYVGEAEKVMPWWKMQGLDPDVIVVDPPRKGCDEALLKAMIDMQPKRVVYVSCNPSTLARDLRILEDGGFATQEVQPVDMFPQTEHVECVSWLEWG